MTIRKLLSPVEEKLPETTNRINGKSHVPYRTHGIWIFH